MRRELDFYACSGATTPQLLLREDPNDVVGQMPESPTDIPGGLVQLEYLRRDPADVDVVLVSIGGNDARFSEIAQGCFLPGTCAELRSLWLSNIETIGPSVRAVYRQIKEIVGDDVPIVAMPYPMLLAEESCGWSLLDGDEHGFLFEFITILNQQIRLSAQREGVNFFADGLLAFDGARICDPDRSNEPAMNLIRLEPPRGDFSSRVSPATWIHNSMHPTVEGHARTAAALQDYLETLLEADDANPDPDPKALLEIGSIRTVQPVVIARDLIDGIMSPDTDSDCSDLMPDTFGERVLLVDQVDDELASRRIPSFVLADADPVAPICFKEGNAPWRSRSRPVAADLGATNASSATGAIPVVVEGGVVSVQPTVPEGGGRLLVLYKTTDRGAQLRIVEFCSEVDSCPATVDEWSEIQLAKTAREAAAPVVVAILAGWFVVVGLNPQRLETEFPDEVPTPLWKRIKERVLSLTSR